MSDKEARLFEVQHPERPAVQVQAVDRQEYTGSREDLIAQGYTPCGQCNP